MDNADRRVKALQEKIASLDPNWYYTLTDYRTGQVLAEGTIDTYIDSILGWPPPERYPASWKLEWKKRT